MKRLEMIIMKRLETSPSDHKLSSITTLRYRPETIQCSLCKESFDKVISVDNWTICGNCLSKMQDTLINFVPTPASHSDFIKGLFEAADTSLDALRTYWMNHRAAEDRVQLDNYEVPSEVCQYSSRYFDLLSDEECDVIASDILSTEYSSETVNEYLSVLYLGLSTVKATGGTNEFLQQLKEKALGAAIYAREEELRVGLIWLLVGILQQGDSYDAKIIEMLEIDRDSRNEKIHHAAEVGLRLLKRCDWFQKHKWEHRSEQEKTNAWGDMP